MFIVNVSAADVLFLIHFRPKTFWRGLAFSQGGSTTSAFEASVGMLGYVLRRAKDSCYYFLFSKH